MTPSSTRANETPNSVLVYGVDHSPWVQAVLLGLHESDVSHQLVAVPPISVFLESGILMPAAKIDGAPWILDSERILRELGGSPLEDADRRALLSLFRGGAQQRTESPWIFWKTFSRARDESPGLPRRLWNHLFRTFSVFYFFTLISLGRLRGGHRSAERLASDLGYFDRRLAEADAASGGERVPFLGGQAPDTVDFELFGQVQMFSSIPCLSLTVLQEEPSLDRLRLWVGEMQARFEDYPHLYSGPCFAPRAEAPVPATPLERLFYWLGCGMVWILFPISLITVLVLARRVDRKKLR